MTMVVDYSHILALWGFMGKNEKTVGAGEFKAKCLKMLDEVAFTKEPIVITKHGKPVATVIPYPAKGKIPIGSMRDSMKIVGDIVQGTGEAWNAEGET